MRMSNVTFEDISRQKLYAFLHKESLQKICDMHTPIKKKLSTKVQLPLMNSKYRKSIKKKSMA